MIVYTLANLLLVKTMKYIKEVVPSIGLTPGWIARLSADYHPRLCILNSLFGGNKDIFVYHWLTINYLGGLLIVAISPLALMWYCLNNKGGDSMNWGGRGHKPRIAPEPAPERDLQDHCQLSDDEIGEQQQRDAEQNRKRLMFNTGYGE